MRRIIQLPRVVDSRRDSRSDVHRALDPRVDISGGAGAAPDRSLLLRRQTPIWQVGEFSCRGRCWVVLRLRLHRLGPLVSLSHRSLLDWRGNATSALASYSTME